MDLHHDHYIVIETPLCTLEGSSCDLGAYVNEIVKVVVKFALY